MGAGVARGDPYSRVTRLWRWGVAPPMVDAGLRGMGVVERRGCDRGPVDPTTTDGRLALTASIWADQTTRLDRLRGALELAARFPASARGDR